MRTVALVLPRLVYLPPKRPSDAGVAELVKSKTLWELAHAKSPWKVPASPNWLNSNRSCDHASDRRARWLQAKLPKCRILDGRSTAAAAGASRRRTRSRCDLNYAEACGDAPTRGRHRSATAAKRARSRRMGRVEMGRCGVLADERATLSKTRRSCRSSRSRFIRSTRQPKIATPI
jgi:hypothetical protein